MSHNEEAVRVLSSYLTKLMQVKSDLTDLEGVLYPMVARRISEAVSDVEDAERQLKSVIDGLKKGS